MSRSSQTIKILRQNFIRRQQQNEYYTCERQKEEDQFNDGELFNSKQFQRKNGSQPRGKIVTLQFKKIDARNGKGQFTQQHQREKGLKIVSWRVGPNKSTTLLPKQSEQQLTMLHNFNTIACPPSFIKTERLRRQAATARQSTRNVIPKYAAYLMKPCSVQTIRIQERPPSAFNRDRNSQSRKYSGFGLKKRGKSQPNKKLSEYLEPWETQEDYA